MRATARDLDCTKSTVHRLKEEAVLLLREALASSPLIQQYLAKRADGGT